MSLSNQESLVCPCLGIDRTCSCERSEQKILQNVGLLIIFKPSLFFHVQTIKRGSSKLKGHPNYSLRGCSPLTPRFAESRRDPTCCRNGADPLPDLLFLPYTGRHFEVYNDMNNFRTFCLIFKFSNQASFYTCRQLKGAHPS